MGYALDNHTGRRIVFTSEAINQTDVHGTATEPTLDTEAL